MRNEIWIAVRRWFDTAAGAPRGDLQSRRIDLLRAVPFALLHLAPVGLFWFGWSWFAVAVAVGLYLLRMFAITAFYHRYFSHRTFTTSRLVQLIFAAIGNAACQRGPLWWAAHHRRHHQHSDQPPDVHSPRQHGFWWSHMGWFLTPASFPTDLDAVRDLSRYPELRWLDRFDIAVPTLLFALLYGIGEYLAVRAPSLGTSGPQLLIWGGVISTLAVFHITCAINSLAHRCGRVRYRTGDDSRNSLLLALLTLGEGWHNNHHHYPVACRQGFRWYEVDPTWWMLCLMQKLGLIGQMRQLPESVRLRNLATTLNEPAP